MKKAVSIVMSAVLILLCFASCGSKGMKGTHHAEMVIKNYGTVKIELYGDQAPLTVENFVNLCNKGFYDGLTFHRYVKDFVLQGGDPEGTGLGGCESSVKGEFSANGVKNTIKHKKGVISMARNQFDFNSASSQFFICLKNSCSDDLDGQYAAFGKITEGMDIIDKLCADLTESDCLPKDQQPVIETIKVID
ncbi:peptidyl-prolyl cis-trans isomerase [Ruminococcus sp. CAG:563]|nr:peptidyl-prolyl cis-trans isomerase [Ruminococcus sp. CAG:563]